MLLSSWKRKTASVEDVSKEGKMSGNFWQSRHFDLFVCMFICALMFAVLSLEGYATAQEMVLHTLMTSSAPGHISQTAGSDN
jgi:hypothetical protein